MSKTLIVHDWIEKVGGAEAVMFEIMKLFPDSKVFTLWSEISDSRFVESKLSKTILRGRKALALPFMDAVFRSIPIDADEIITTSHLFAHHARLLSNPDVKKFSYIHTPARYLWNPELDPRGANPGLRLLAPFLKKLDFARAQESHQLAVNSEFVRQRVKEVWNRESNVIYPPVDTDFFMRSHESELSTSELEILHSLPSEFLISASRLVAYKKTETAALAAIEARIPIVIAGSGPQENSILKLAANNPEIVYFLRTPSKELLATLYKRAMALIFLGVEDFGIVPVEAMASGTPVLGIRAGGLLETVKPGFTGELVEDLQPRSMQSGIKRILKNSYPECVNQALRFSRKNFARSFESWIWNSR